MRFADGHEQVIGTDAGWTAGPSATTANDLYDGQDIDVRAGGTGWLEPGFAADSWTGVHEWNAWATSWGRRGRLGPL